MATTVETADGRKTKSVDYVEVDAVTIRFAGDSGDGMQLTGTQFTTTTAQLGNDLSTFPDYPSEIRAPSGTLYGVSGFQIRFSSKPIYTPGDRFDTLIAMNPAALKVNLKQLHEGGNIIVNVDSFDAKNLKLAKYDTNPLEDESLGAYKVFPVRITSLTNKALEDTGLSPKEMARSKNFFALGLLYWMYNRPMDSTLEWIKVKFGKAPKVALANELALKAGYSFGNMTEVFSVQYNVRPAALPAGTYRNVTGNEATALGMVAATIKSGLPGFLGSYPITPATEILQELAKRKNFGFKTFQAEDEIAGVCTAIGASFGGSLSFTTTSGPGMALKTEAIGLALMVELPLVVIDVQRGGPSTGLPTKPEQSDLFQAVLGRNGEAPVPVIAASSPANCFFAAFEASRLALKYMTPVVLLTDGFLANGSEPWLLPKDEDLPDISVPFASDPENYQPYARNEHLSRPWAVPGMAGFEHRIGGLEKQHITGAVSHDPMNHQFMVEMRAKKVAGIANDIPAQTVFGHEDADLVILGWGGTYGDIRTAVERMQAKGHSVAHVHVKYLNPFPKNLGDVLSRFKKILLPEMNLGQLAFLLRAHYHFDPISMPKVQGRPFTPMEIEEKAIEILNTL
ncbi:MAG: 2-oxoacid:acceptor oxidoreductase subunit alpha [Bacteroidota bacterium]|jgi:2-oxoglutarate ferredoxin oxidoreductase subunit alpha|nr:2-oxoacid:acceptor oxidoreductase subunit alpha [Bacteroidota bacterium]